MSSYQIDSLVVSVFRRRGFWARPVDGEAPPPPPPPPSPSTITTALRVSHVPDGDSRQSTMVAASGTTITGTAPLLLFFDAADTRCSATALTDTAAWWNLQYRLNYGYGEGQSWPISGKPYNYDEGEPLFGRVIEDPDTCTMSLTVKNPLGGYDVRTFTVVATAPPAPTIIEVAAGTWPTWVSGTHYALRAGGNYLGFGDILMGGHHDIIISKVGTGADPEVSGFNPDSRDIRDFTEVVEPSRNIRLMDIDVSRYYSGAMGPQFCGCIRGRVRAYEGAAFGYVYDTSANTEARRANTRIPRGVFLWKTGELNCPFLDQYVMITSFRELVMQGVYVRKNGPTGNHALRNYGRDQVYRHDELAALVASASIVKTQAGNGVVPWIDSEDTVGTITGAKAFEHRPASRFVFADIVYHTATSVIPDICVGAGAENNDEGYGHGSSELIAFSNSVSSRNEWQSVAGLDVQVNGRGHSTRNIRLANGTYVTQSAGAYTNNLPPGFNGPYLYETVNTRPTI